MFICKLSDLDNNQSMGFEINGESYFIVQHDDMIRVYKNHCPHLGIELEWLEHQFLDAEKQYIQCSTHGALFNISSGECVSGPCIGDKLTNVNVDIIDGDIFLKP